MDIVIPNSSYFFKHRVWRLSRISSTCLLLHPFPVMVRQLSAGPLPLFPNGAMLIFFCQRITLVIQSRLSLVFSLFCSFFLHLLGVEIERSRMLMNINVAALLSPERVSLSLSACLAFRFCWWKGNYGRKSVEVSPLGWWGGGGREPHANEPLININAHPLLAGESGEGDMLSL